MRPKAKLTMHGAAVFVAAILGLSVAAKGADVPQVSGSVLAPNGAPIANATVEFDAASGVVARSKTGKDGAFHFSAPGEGTYFLKSYAVHFKPVTSAPFNLRSGEQLNLTIVLEPLSTTGVTTLGRVTVTGHQPLDTSPASTITISNDRFVQSGTLRIDRLLDQLPGVTIGPYAAGTGENLANGGSSAPSSIAIRGAGAGGPFLNSSYENLVLQDGEPMRTGESGSFDLSTLTPAIYSRVEVVEGVGGTSLFGANSVGGTLNLVTRDPLKTEGGQGLVSVGSYGVTDLNLLESNTLGRFGYLLDYHTYTTDGEIPTNAIVDSSDFFSIPPGTGEPPCYPCPAAIGYLYHPSYSETLRSGLVKLRYDLSNATYAVVTGSTEWDFRDGSGLTARAQPVIVPGAVCPNPVPYFGVSACLTDPLGYLYVTDYPGYHRTNQQPKVAVELHTPLGPGSLIIRSYDQFLQNVDDRQGAPAAACCVVQRIRDHLSGGLVSWTVLAGKHVVTVGAGANGDTDFVAVGSTTDLPIPFSQLHDFGSQTQIDREYLIRDEFQSSDKLSLTFTGYYSSYDVLHVRRFDPRIAIVLKPNPNTVAKLSIASGFAAPRLGDLTPFNPTFLAFGGFAQPGSPCPSSEPACFTFSGNPDLKVERAVGLDASYQQAFGNGGFVSLGVYRNNLRDHIYPGFLPAPPGYRFANGTPVLFLQEPTNIVGSVFTGLEFRGSLPLSTTFSLDGTYNAQSAYPTGVDVATAILDQVLVNNQQFLNTPLHKESASVRYHTKAGTTAYFSWRFYDANNAYSLPPFSVYDAGTTVPIGENALHITFSNLFNANGSLYPSLPGVFYSGYSGPVEQTRVNFPPHSVLVTFEHRWGSLR